MREVRVEVLVHDLRGEAPVRIELAAERLPARRVAVVEVAHGVEHGGHERAKIGAARAVQARDPDDGEELSVEDRRALAGVLTLDVTLGEEVFAMMHAIERMCDGLLAALTARSPDRLPLPGLRA